MTTLGGQASATGNPAIHPSRWWYWIAGGMVAGAVICIALAVAGFFSVNRQITDFQRVPVPGQAGVTFTASGGYVIYIEKPGQCCSFNVSTGSSGPFSSWSMDLALQPVDGGTQVPVSIWQGTTLSYSIAGHQGQTAVYFTIDRPGRYLLATGNATPGSITDVAVGRGIGRGILVPFILIAVGSLAALAGLVTGVVAVSRRRKPGPPVMPPMGDWRSPAGTPGEHAAGGHLVPSHSYLQGGPARFGEAVKHGLRDWTVYRGRASRSAYWWFVLFTVIVSVALDVIAFVITASANTAAASVLITVLFVVIAVVFVVVAIYLGLAQLALLVRRLHDSGRSGWWALIGVVPIVGAIMLLVFTLIEGTPGPNRYDLVAADAAAGPPPPGCLECGAENAGAAQVCPRCGAPLAHQPPVAAGAVGGSRGSIPLPHELAGQTTKPRAERNALVIAGGGLAALVAVIVVLALASSPTSTSNIAQPAASASSPPQTAPPASPADAASVPSPSPTDSLTGPLGTTFTVTSYDGSSTYDVTLDKVTQHVKLGQYDTLINGQDHAAAAEFSITGRSGSSRDDAFVDASAIGSDQTEYQSSPITENLPQFSYGEFQVAPGQTVKGWVTFELPPGVTVAQVQWASGDGGAVTWTVAS